MTAEIPVQLNPWLVGALCMGSIALVFIGIARLVGGSRSVSDRFEHYVWRGRAGAAPADPARSAGVLTRSVESALQRRGRGVDLARELARADIKLTPAEFVIVSLTGVLTALGVGLLIFRV
jgi:hypothetical protein